MNWRKLLLLYAANILDDIGESETAQRLRRIRVPIMDGGGFWIGVWNSQGRVDTVSPQLQNFDPTVGNFVPRGKSAMLLFPIYISVVEREAVERAALAELPAWAGVEVACER